MLVGMSDARFYYFAFTDRFLYTEGRAGRSCASVRR
jgi:hypothetical protein